MDKLKEELKVLKSWGIESISVDKVLSIIEETEDDSKISSREQGVEVSSAPTDLIPVGGTIFHIDNTAEGEYQFFDVDGSVIDSVNVGDKPYAYKVIKKGSRDKYYVYHDEAYDKLEWTYHKGKVSVYESLGTSEDRGSGKTNTEIVMAKDNGVYITDDSDGSPTIWYRLQQMNDVRVGGCNDWFIPSVYEMETLRMAILSGSVTGGKIAGSSYKESVFSKKWLWSSSEDSARDSARNSWHWSSNGQNWYTYGKNFNNSVFFVRAF